MIETALFRNIIQPGSSPRGGGAALEALRRVR